MARSVGQEGAIVDPTEGNRNQRRRLKELALALRLEGSAREPAPDWLILLSTTLEQLIERLSSVGDYRNRFHPNGSLLLGKDGSEPSAGATRSVRI